MWSLTRIDINPSGRALAYTHCIYLLDHFLQKYAMHDMDTALLIVAQIVILKYYQLIHQQHQLIPY